MSETVIKVRVLFFGAARDVAGAGEASLTLSGSVDSGDAFEQVLAAYPELRRFGRSLLFAVNQEYAPVDLLVCEGDELAVFPPVSGGAPGGTGRHGDGGDELTRISILENSANANPGSAGVPPAST